MKRGVEERLRALAREYGLTEGQQAQLARLLDVLAAAPAAPTTVTRPEEAVDVHVADSLSGLTLPELARAVVVADLGSGAGIPALVLAVALPDSHVFAVESASRKCRFIAAAAEHVGVANFDVVCARAEEWVSGRDANDAVTVRAVADLAVLCEYAAPLLRVGGTLIAWKGARDADEERAARGACSKLGLADPISLPVAPYPGSHSRHLYSARKVAATPPGYPRRAGMAVKRPLM